jgi:hypothetical protein
MPGKGVFVAVRYSRCSAAAGVAHPAGRGFRHVLTVPWPGSISPLPVPAWRAAAWLGRRGSAT